MASFGELPLAAPIDAMTGNGNGKSRPIRAGKAVMAAIENDPQAQRAVGEVAAKLRMYAQGIKTIGPTLSDALGVLQNVFASIAVPARDELRVLHAEQQNAFAELAAELRQAISAKNADLAAHGFDPPGEELDEWENLARLVEKEPGPMTFEEIYRWAIAWAKREAFRLKLARGIASQQSGGDKHDANTEREQKHDQPVAARVDSDARRDEHDPRLAWFMGKRIYLGDDTQIGRLFWLLASPIGRARSLGEVQQAVDGFESDADMDATGDEVKKAAQRVRKAFSKLRDALRQAEVDDHILIVRGGTQDFPEYTMLRRFENP